MMPKMILRSGGQSGVDRALLDFAIERQRPYAGWCPRGGWAEDFPDPPGLLAKYPNLTATPSAAPEQRTAWNVRDSHATIILIPDEMAIHSPGTAFTRLCAEVIFLRPCRIVDMSQSTALTDSREWLARVVEESNELTFALNVAGPRASAAPGVYDVSRRILIGLLES